MISFLKHIAVFQVHILIKLPERTRQNSSSHLSGISIPVVNFSHPPNQHAVNKYSKHLEVGEVVQMQGEE